MADKLMAVKTWGTLHRMRAVEIAQVADVMEALVSEIDGAMKCRMRRWRTLIEAVSETAAMTHLIENDRVPHVMKVGKTVAGFMFCTLQMAGVQLDYMAIDPKHRRMGLGSEMIEQLKSSMYRLRRETIEVQVAERNVGALLFFRQCGFKWFQSVDARTTGFETYHLRRSVYGQRSSQAIWTDRCSAGPYGQ